MKIVIAILPVMIMSLLLVLISPMKLSHRFACSMESIVYTLIILYTLILILAREGDIYIEGYTLR
jgi:hypothetical protein